MPPLSFAIVAAISIYLYKEKKKGTTCIGCPYAKKCGGKCSGGNNLPQTK
ncbi:MAG: hypothetical protein IJB68_12015 [Ruminococcus sp.]|nr:hypothetical protein [Ruminococcus sp.]